MIPSGGVFKFNCQICIFNSANKLSHFLQAFKAQFGLYKSLICVSQPMLVVHFVLTEEELEGKVHLIPVALHP